ncbi:acetylornithine deacetylase [Marinagarivorans algicola]|uniref:acetylornithine deacetylase n=1 Tax=Marinagarivorans algicola TaxID=1513270 RepID=UPI0006B4E34B|nr:acetylornithine deacetylase [Marinagarivorans algicola]
MDYHTYTEQLSQLVALPSVSCADPALDCSNKAVVDLLATWFEPLGFDCRIEPVLGYPNKYNLIAVRGSGDGGVVLSGHTDTVPYNAERWEQDPLTLTQKHERLYGLGATDMKGFFPAIWAALQAFDGVSFKEPVIILATADEESSMSGARALSEQQFPKARYAIIGEPTGMRPVNMHKGIMMEAVRVNGQAGHSSNPALGNNAMEAMHTVMTEILSYRADLQARYHNPTFEVQVPTLNLGCIHGGDNPNRICSACELHFDLRMLPGMSIDELRQGLQTRLTPIAEQTQTDIIFSALFPGVPAFEQPANSALIETVKKLTGHNPESVAFATEAPFLQAQGLQTVIMGPGSIDQAHQANEYIALSELAPAVKTLEGVIRAFCV